MDRDIVPTLEQGFRVVLWLWFFGVGERLCGRSQPTRFEPEREQ
jgi:hypothetical protein